MAAPPPDLHALAQALAVASLSVDTAGRFLSRGDTARVRACLDAAATALAQGGDWIDAQRAVPLRGRVPGGGVGAAEPGARSEAPV
jgi:hypothetical protein